MSADKITVSLAGGLGNQLFQWATGYAVSKTLGVSLELDDSKIVRSEKKLDRRSYALDYFSIRKPPPGSRNLRGIADLLRRLPGTAEKKAFAESSFLYDAKIRSITPGTSISGNFQSWRYFESYSSEIRTLLSSNARTTQAFQELQAKLEGKRWVGVHVRRGDYRNFPEIFQLLPREYYSNALNSIGPEAIDEIVVFSEELSDGLATVPQGTTFVDQHRIAEPGDIVMLLAGATHIIGANSSLSWWGAYMNVAPNAERVFPSQWFGPKGWATEDLLPASWKTVPNI